MFSSLNRVDIVANDKDGRRLLVQTDHRTAAEIAEEPELSVAFALVRVLNPKRMTEPDEPEPTVVYSTIDPPPDFLRVTIRAAGGLFMIGEVPTLVPDDSEPRALLDEVIQSAFGKLAVAVAKQYDLDYTPSAVARLEATFADPPDAEEAEIEYWSAVLKLGAFSGEVIRKSIGGNWVQTNTGTLPFALSTTFRGESATVNPLGKAIKLFENGEEDSVALLVRLITGSP